MRSVELLIKPASSLCNMRCRYCFYTDEAENRTVSSMGIMSPQIREIVIRSALEAVDQDGLVSFAFQGGEPTVAGLDFFRSFIELVTTLNQKRCSVRWSIQTNGLSLDKAWARFFAEHRFLVGISLDGDKGLHDRNRLDLNGKATWDRIREKLDLLTEENVDWNLLCVVTGQCAKNPERAYQALKETGSRYLQFIPCLDPLEKPRGSMEWSLTPERYGTFLCRLFDQWYMDWKNGHYTSIRLFDDHVHLLMGLPPSTCSSSGSCGSYFVVEADGSVYPCDFYVLDEWKLGQIGMTSLEDLSRSITASRFLTQSLLHPTECADCAWKSLCNGGCRRDWYQDKGGTTKNYYCPAFQQYFSYALPRLQEIAHAERAAQQERNLF